MENSYKLSKIHNYITGLMSRDEMYALEKEALNDPFLQDAIDGYRLQNGVDAKQLSLLQKRIASRLSASKEIKSKQYYNWQRLTIGMTAAVLFVVVCTLLVIRYLPQQKSSLTEVELMQDNVYSITVSSTGRFTGEPLNGLEAFENYLSHNYIGRNHQEGEILVYFKINEQGRPSQVLINTGKGSANAYQEIVELLERGPKWKGNEVELLIDVHLLNL